MLPNNKARSVKLNARNLQGLQMATVALTQESKNMEEKLKQLKESMSKEKEERGLFRHSGAFRWRSGHCGSLNSNALTNNSKKDKENRIQKLSAGKVKIRVLRDEPLTAAPQTQPAPPTAGVQTTGKNRLKGTMCGQCETRMAGLICAECSENYCIGCFTTFHQKGALKVHRTVPIQVLDVNNEEEKKVEMSGEDLKKEDKKEFGDSLLRGEFNEEESARSFQEALRQWRGETSDGGGEFKNEEAMWRPIRPGLKESAYHCSRRVIRGCERSVGGGPPPRHSTSRLSLSVSAKAIQADSPLDREAEKRGRGGKQERVPVRVEFTQNNLTYMDRLLLKKHRRTPTKTYDPLLDFGPDLKSLTFTNTEEEESSITAQEEDFRRYCASLFAVPVHTGNTEAQITTPQPSLIIEVLDETDRDINGVFVAEQRTNNNRKVLTSGGSSRVSRVSPSPKQPPTPTQSKTAQRLNPPKPQTSQAENSMKPLSSKSMTPASLTETPKTPKTPKTSIPKSQKPSCNPFVHKTKADHSSSQLLSSLPDSQAEILKPSRSPLSLPPDVSPLASTQSSIPKEHRSPSPSTSTPLRSTFTISPSSSTESILLPKISHSTPVQRDLDSSQQFQFSKFFPDSISSPRLSQSPQSYLESSPEQSQYSSLRGECETLLSDNQLQLPQSPTSITQPKFLERRLTQTNPVPFRVKTLSSSSLYNESPTEVISRCKSTPVYGDAQVVGDLESTRQDTVCIPTLSSHPLQVTQNLPLAVEMKDEEGKSLDSGDEMSSDSLFLALRDEGSSDEEAQIRECLTRGRSGEDRGNSATSHRGDALVPADAESKKDLQTDEPELLSETSMVMLNQRAGSGSELLCDLAGVSPPGLDLISGHSDAPEHTHWFPLQTCQTSPQHPNPTGSNWSGRSTPTQSTQRSSLMLGSELSPAFRPPSRAAQEIMEICSVDQAGCEDPDLDTDTAAHTIHCLEQELRLITMKTWTQASVFDRGNSRGRDQHANQHSTQNRVTEEDEEEEDEDQRDRQSVLLLP